MAQTQKASINGILLLVTLIINGMGATGRINGFSQKAVSDMFITLITPAPSTFSIWGVIYSLLIASIIMMIVAKNDRYYRVAVDRISGLFWFSCVINALWIVTFSYVQIGLSAIFIFAFAVTLSLIMQRLREIQDKTHFLLPLTFGIYTGWLFIATVVNISAWLVQLKWSGFGLSNEFWGAIMLNVAVLLVLGVMTKNRNAAFPLPLAWAYLGIYRFLIAPEGFKGQYGMLQTVCLAGIALYAIMAIVQFYRNGFAVLPDASS